MREGRINRSGRQRIATSTPSRPSSANCAAPSEAPTSYDAVRGDTGGKTAGCRARKGFGSGSPKARPKALVRSGSLSDPIASCESGSIRLLWEKAAGKVVLP